MYKVSNHYWWDIFYQQNRHNNRKSSFLKLLAVFLLLTIFHKTYAQIGPVFTVCPCGVIVQNNQPCPCVTYFRDADGDGFGNPNITFLGVSGTLPAGYSANNTDCNDSDKTIYPGAPELCDGKDNDCNSTIDDNIVFLIYYLDDDGDGFGNPSISKTDCSIPEKYVRNNTDCNDNDPDINKPGTFYRDFDEDGFGDPNSTQQSCTATLGGYVTNKDDCDDQNRYVAINTWVLDADNDALYVGQPVTTCSSPGIGYRLKTTQQPGDCNDNDASNKTVMYVSKNVTGFIQDGNSWATAFKTLQDALANVNGCTRQIWIAKGTYYPDEGVGAINNDRNATFSLKEGVSIYGGFSGIETSIDQRNLTLNKTVLSGDIDQNDNGGIASQANNSYHVVDGSNARNAPITIDGFTIKGGNALGHFFYEELGAGIHGGSGKVVNCIFTENIAKIGGALAIGGSYYYLEGNERVDVTAEVINCLFYNNIAEAGAAICVYAGLSSGYTGITNCTFFNEGSIITTQGFYVRPAIQNSIFWGSDAPFSTDSYVKYSIIQGGHLNYDNTSEGNLSVDPLFIDPANGNFQVQQISPAVNAGNDLLYSELLDLAGNPRKAGIIDMGAYELQPQVQPCPSISTITTSPTPASCQGANVTLTASGLTGMGTTYGITFKYFNEQTTDPYTGGTVIASLVNGSLTDNGTVATTSTSALPSGNGFIYAVLSPVPANTECRPAQMVNVTINTLSTPPTSITGTITICSGQSTTLTLSGGTAGTGATAQWFAGSCGSTLIGTGNSITVSPTVNTTYFVRYSGTCNTTACASVAVTVNTLSTAPTGITGTTTICNGQSTTLTISGGIAGTGATAQWFAGSCGSTVIGTGNSITVSPTVNTTYFVRYSGTCNTTACASVGVNVKTLSTAPKIAGTNTICNGQSTTLTAYDGIRGTGAEIEWFAGSCDGTPIEVGRFAITVSPASTTTYYARYKGDCNTTECAMRTVTVNTLSVAPTAITGDLVICTGESTTLTLAGGFAGTGATAQWFAGSCGSTVIGTGNSITVSPTVNTTYYVRYSGICNTTSCASVALTVKTAAFIAVPGNITQTNTVGKCGATVNYNSTVTGYPAPVVTYQFSGATNGSGSGTGSGSFFNVGTTDVLLVAENDCGISRSTFSITVSDNELPTIISVTASPSSLWPPNHKMKTVTLTTESTDNCGKPDCKIIGVISNEPEVGTGDGDLPNDWLITGSNTVELRAERSGAGNGRIYDIFVECTDASGNKATSKTQVIVAHNITAPQSGASYKIGSTVSFAGTFWDVPGNKHTARWVIDNSTVAGRVTAEPSGLKSGTVTGSYKFSTAGVYKLKMEIIDHNGNVSYANTNGDIDAIVVIYDPNGGYTFGGGSFNTTAGKVSYGFQNNYFKTATNPKGETQLEFKNGDFEFNALNFEYLSVSNAKAQLRGTGKITNGQSGINFIMTVIDGALDGTGKDKIRLKIFNKNTNEVYFDNQSGASDAADPVTVVNSGSTIVIGGTGKTRNEEEPVITAVPTFEVITAPNPSDSYFTLTVKSSNTTDRILVRVMDELGRVVEQKENVMSGTTIRFGDKYIPGMYFIMVQQGNNSKAVKLIRR
ncbi:Ig-like domain-containing protein [Lacibacter sediminis]|uniref:T9SS type A sorting domain-containing protein n=1 Tax=Lacibacter sediminis TaxID=2760713 RepID=A0A7G5XFB3_9BACT|nr:MopE-related protein [Lacibacter sediminis]QNA44166.1 T9SS type A sorting domain-containing protein [Lacibacter sediminis]